MSRDVANDTLTLVVAFEPVTKGQNITYLL